MISIFDTLILFIAIQRRQHPASNPSERLKNEWIKLPQKDLQNVFPETRVFSERNIERMNQFAQLYPSLEFPTQAVPELCTINTKG